MAPMVGAVVFDIGGVLLEWDPVLLYRQLVADPAELEWFLSQVCTPEWNGTRMPGDRSTRRVTSWPPAIQGTPR